MSSLGSKSVLQSCLSTINVQSGLMKQCLLENNLLQALKHCLNFLNELRTSQLPPKQYYEIYMVVFDSLDILSSHLLTSYQAKIKKKSTSSFLSDLYELVQYSGNIVPRLYMMILVGTTYMLTDEAPKKEIMKDMIEMCRGVQHPIRGLFLRYYLSQRIKDLLPIATKQDLDETVDFLVSNFLEMNKLWVRLQHQGHSSERELRYNERHEMKILVGSNLVRLSQIIDDFAGDEENYKPVTFYKEKIFPVITEQIIQCKDHLAQSYLIDVIIQIFPVNFHFATLHELLNDTFLNLRPSIKKSELVLTLVDRFITYHHFEYESLSEIEKVVINDQEEGEAEQKSTEQKQISTAENAFEEFWGFYLKLVEIDPNLPSEEHSSMLQAFIKLSMTYEPKNFANLEKIYEFASSVVSKNASAESDLKRANISLDEKSWLLLLTVPIEHFSSVNDLLSLNYFYVFYSGLNNSTYQKRIALEIADKVISEGIESGLTFPTTEEIDSIFKFLTVLIEDDDSILNTSKDLGITKSFSINEGSKFVSKDFLINQEKISKVLHFVYQKDPFKTLTNLNYIRRKYLNKKPKNIIYTYPTLISQTLKYLRIAANSKREEEPESINDDNTDFFITSNFKNLSVTIDELYQHHQQYHLPLVLNFYLNSASLADQLKQETISYEFFNQAFIVYEENLILNSSKINQNPHVSIGGSIPYQLVIIIANRLMNLRYFTRENYENLITKVTLYGSKLLKKQDQCRSVYYCAHLWWWCETFITDISPTVKIDKDEEKNEKNEVGGKDDDQDDEKKVGKQDNQEDTPEVLKFYRDPKRVLECLQKSLRVADSCMDPYLSLKLFIEILNRCLIFYIYGNEYVDSNYINGLIDLIKTNIDNLKNENDEDGDIFASIQSLFQRTLDYIDNEKATSGQYQNIVT